MVFPESVKALSLVRHSTDSGFRSTISKHKFKSNIISLLQQEDTINLEIFRSLQESDFRL